MSSYDVLSDWLRRQPGDRVSVLFDDIEDEDRIGVELPMTARRRREWWGNETSDDSRHVQCRSWLNAGWKVAEVNLGRETVVFTRFVRQQG
jgi:hypothetical protein